MFLIASFSLYGEVKTWNSEMTGSSWNHPDHWTPSEIPKVGDTIQFNTLSETPKNQFMVSLLAPSVAGSIEFNNQNPNTSYHLFGKVPLRLESPSSILIRESNQSLTKIDVPLLITKDLLIQNQSAQPLLLDGNITGAGASLYLMGPGEVQIGGEDNNTFSGNIEIHGPSVFLNKKKGFNAIAHNVNLYSGRLKGSQIGSTASINLIGSEENVFLNVGQSKESIQNLHFHHSPFSKEATIEKGGELTILNTLCMSDHSKLGGEGTLVLGGNSSLLFKGLGENGEIDVSIDLQGQNRTFFVDSNTLLINGKIGNGDLTKTGSGTLALNGENTHNHTIVKEGTLVTTTNSLPKGVVADGTLHIHQAFEGSFKEPLIGTGELLKTGEGKLTINQNTPFHGKMNVQQGSIQTNGIAAAGDLHVDAFLSLKVDSPSVFKKNISGTGTIKKEGLGNLALKGESSFNGNLELKEGSIEGTTSSLKGHIINNALLSFTQDFDGFFFGTLNGNGEIAKNGTGALVLNQKNTPSGPFSLNEGKLILADNSALGNSSLRMQSDTTLALIPNISIPNQIALEQKGQGMLNVALGKASLNGTLKGGTFLKTGNGSLEISNGGNITGLSVLKGALELGGELEIQEPIFVEKGAQLFGTGKVIGEVQSNGILSGGRIVPEKVPFDMDKAIEAFNFEKSTEQELTKWNELYLVGDCSTKSVSGKAKIHGDVHLTTESTCLVNFNPNSFSEISVDGDVYLNHATLQLEPFAGSYRVGKEYKILEATNIHGEFGEVITPFPMINPMINYNNINGNVSISFGMQMHSFSDLFKTGNAGQVAKCLDFLTDHPYENSNTVILALQNMQPESALKKSLEKMQPSQLTALSVVQENDLLYVRNAIYQRLYDTQKTCTLPSVDQKPPVSIWGSFFGGYTTQENQGGDPGYLAKTPGVILGADLDLRNGSTIGGAFSYAYTRHEWNQSRGDANIHNLYASAYGQYAGERGYVEASLLGGYSFYDAERTIVFGPFNSTRATAKSNFGGGEGAVDLKAGLRFPFKSFAVSPFASLDYMLVHLNSFKESGARSLNLKVNSRLGDLLTSEGGVQFDFCQRKDATFLKAYLQLSAILESRFIGDTQESSFVGGCSMKTKGFYPTRVLAGLGMGVSAAFGRNVFAASYRVKSQWEFTDQSMTFQYLWKF